MRFVLFYHSLVSCWNHGNAHFLRGIVRELIAQDHEVVVYEPREGWSRVNALRDAGAAALPDAQTLVPGVDARFYDDATLDLTEATDGADVVMAHEWTAPAIVGGLSRLRLAGGRFTLLFHDTHHRGVTSPHEIDGFDLEGHDAVLAFGDVLREVYLRKGWSRRAFTWHEAADTAVFRPMTDVAPDLDMIWIGNWGDGEREKELQEYLIAPIENLGLNARIHGVRYPEAAREALARAGVDYAGWLPNHRAPRAFAQARMTAHVPRAPYVEAAPGIPTIRVFEALACGVPLVSAPWRDAEGLFPPGAFMMARDGAAMTCAMRDVLNDAALATSLRETGLAAIRARHTCAHRVAELFGVLEALRSDRAGACASERQGTLVS